MPQIKGKRVVVTLECTEARALGFGGFPVMRWTSAVTKASTSAVARTSIQVIAGRIGSPD